MEKIFSPQESRELIRGWQIHIRKNWKKHEEAARRLELQYRRVGVASVVLSTAVGASVFASLEAAYEPWSRIIAGLVSLSASVLSSLITFNRYEERTEKHRAISARYKAGLRRLEQILATPNGERLNQESLDRIRQELDELEASAPVVPEDINRGTEARYQEYRFVPKASDLAFEQEKRTADEVPAQRPPSGAA